MSPGEGHNFTKISSKLPQVGEKRRVEPATSAAIASSTVDPKKSGDGTKTPLEVRQSGLSKRALRGVRRSGFAAAAPVTGAGASGDTSGPSHNWAAIAASPSRPQMREQIAKTKAETGVKRASTLRTVAQSLGHWTHLGRPCASPSAGPEASRTELIFGKPGEGRNMPTRDTGSSREGLCVHVSPQSLREPAESPSSLPPTARRHSGQDRRRRRDYPSKDEGTARRTNTLLEHIRGRSIHTSGRHVSR